MGTEPSPQAWRAVIAALANPEARAVYAEIVLALPHGGPLRTAKHDRIVHQLMRAGLVRSDGARVVADGNRLRSMLADDRASRPRVGVERFLTAEGAIDRYPANADERSRLLRVVAERSVDVGETLSEAELNARLEPFDADVARLRRHLVDHRLLTRTRTGSEYTRSRPTSA